MPGWPITSANIRLALTTSWLSPTFSHRLLSLAASVKLAAYAGNRPKALKAAPQEQGQVRFKKFVRKPVFYHGFQNAAKSTSTEATEATVCCIGCTEVEPGCQGKLSQGDTPGQANTPAQNKDDKSMRPCCIHVAHWNANLTNSYKSISRCKLIQTHCRIISAAVSNSIRAQTQPAWHKMPCLLKRQLSKREVHFSNCYCCITSNTLPFS